MSNGYSLVFGMQGFCFIGETTGRHAMDFRRLLQEERRRARESAAQKAPRATEDARSERQSGDASAHAISESETAHAPRDERLNAWRGRHQLPLDEFAVVGINLVYYIPDWMTRDEEAAILDKVHGAPESAWVQLKHRRLQMYGGEVKPPFHPEPLPAWLLQMVDALVENGVFTRDVTPNHALINEYGVGDCILPHEDGPSYFPLVAIASTGADARVTFAPHRKHAHDTSLQEISFVVQRRSLLLFTKDAYTKYLHSIDGVESGKRVSLTIRHVHVHDEKTP